MRRCSGSTLLVVLFLSLAVLAPNLGAQVDRITIAAGTDEDHALQAISAQADSQKKIAMYEEFVQKFSSNPAAAAYGDWQLAQAYQTAGDLQKSLEYGDKALAASPRNLDILVSQAGTAQQAKNNVKLMDYAAKGGEVCASLAKQSKPEGMSDDDFARKDSEEKSALQSSCDFLETSDFNAITSETDPKNRMPRSRNSRLPFRNQSSENRCRTMQNVHAGSWTIERSGAWFRLAKRFWRPTRTRCGACYWLVTMAMTRSRGVPRRRSSMRKKRLKSPSQMLQMRISRESFRLELRTIRSGGPILSRRKPPAPFPS
jgi:hypothetical protein